ncbi:hypothetical protein ACKTEK_08750 [Tepidamorphus sp. 3E244]|uniref:hypothetical protein n=1 Tax=Tepidamorphus sp. 3E244 TaxID=3385498 RepID=UPI0038FC0F17
MKTRHQITALVAMQIAPVIFGLGIIAVLMIPALNANAMYLIPLAVAASFLISPLIAYRIAPELRTARLYEDSPRRAA